MLLRRFVLLTLVLALPGLARAQGSRKDDIVLSRQGQPVAGATVRVCTSGATGAPCSPLAAIFSDVALTQPLANPMTSDGQGNYHFYASPGRYMVQISGAGAAVTTIPDVLLAADPTAPSYQSLTVTQNISAASLNLTGNLSVSGAVSSPTSVSAPQTGATGPVQIGPHWYQGTQSGLVTPPTSGPTLTNESTTGGTIAGGQSIYCVDVYENRNGTTTQSPQTSLAIPAGTNTNRVTVQQGDRNWTTGAYGFRAYCGTSNGGPYYLQQQQVLSVNISSVVASAANGYTGGGGNWALVTTSSAHGVWTGMSVIIAGVTGCSGGSPNGTFTVVLAPSNTTFVISIGSGLFGCTASTGTLSWTNEINANHAHLVPGYFIMSQLNGSGSTPPVSNTATIGPAQVALNATCPGGGPPANACAGVLEIPAAGAALTTPLILSNQEKIVGPSTPRTGTSAITCTWADPWTGCVIAVGSSGNSVEGINIESAGNGLMLFSTNVSSRFAGGTIVGGYPGLLGLYGAVRIMSGTGQIFGIHFEDVYLSGDRAAVFITNSIGAGLIFEGGRWDTNIAAFVDESGPGDPDRMGIGVGGAISGVSLKNITTESGTGVVFDFRNVGTVLDNMLQADSVPAANTPSIVRYGVDSWGSGAPIFNEIRNTRLISSSNYGAMVQYVSNSGNSLSVQLFENMTFGGGTVCIDEGNVLGTTPVALVNVGQCDPTPGAGHVINFSSVGTGITVVGAYGSGYPSMFGRQFIMAPESGGFPGKARHWFIDTASNNNFCLNPPGTFTISATAQADLCVDNQDNAYILGKLSFGGGTATSRGMFAPPGGGFTATRTFTWPDASGTPALALTGTSSSLGGSALTAGTCSSTTVSISGATTGMAAVASPASDPGAGYYWLAFVSASNTVTVRICAAVAGTPTAATYNVRVIQ